MTAAARAAKAAQYDYAQHTSMLSVLGTPGTQVKVSFRDGREVYGEVRVGAISGSRDAVLRPWATRVDLRVALSEVRTASVVTGLTWSVMRDIYARQRAQRSWP